MKLFLDTYALVVGDNCTKCILDTDVKTCDKLRPTCLKNAGKVFIQVTETQKLIFEQLDKLDSRLNDMSIRLDALTERISSDV
jgi:hypothetical protein